MTTIESLEHKGTEYESLYDVGMPANWYQTFGRHSLMWPIPMMGRSGKPDGSGVTWPLRQGGSSVSDERMEVRLKFYNRVGKSYKRAIITKEK